MTRKHIQVDYLARCEGETGLDVWVEDGEVRDVKLEVFEPPRFFEGFVVGRHFSEVPGLVSRICGICPTPHQLTACRALERALGLEVSPQTEDLRRLLALSAWLQSHTLHVYLLAAPDYLGYPSVVEMAGVPELLPVVQRALKLKRLANDLTAAVGGREVHPVTVAVGGFTALPDPETLKQLGERLEEAREDARATVELVAGLPLPDFTRRAEHVSLRHPEEYAVNRGRLVSTQGLNVEDQEYPHYLVESHVPHANAKHAVVAGRGSFLVGPLARVNNNLQQLAPAAREALAKAGVPFPNFNPFASALARAVEIVHGVEECLDLIGRLELQPEEPLPVRPRAGEGFAVTEAARGICCHGYRLNGEGLVEKADIVAPTARNALNIEHDLYQFVPGLLDLPQEEATLQCEMLIRAYDPCFSCATHFLRLNIQRRGEGSEG